MTSESPEAQAEVLAVLAAEREITRVRSWEKVEPAARALDGGVALPDPSPHTDGLRTREDPSYARG